MRYQNAIWVCNSSISSSMFMQEKAISVLQTLKAKHGNLVDKTSHKLWVVCGFKNLSEEEASVGRVTTKISAQCLEELSRREVTWLNRFSTYEINWLFLKRLLEERHIYMEEKWIPGFTALKVTVTILCGGREDVAIKIKPLSMTLILTGLTQWRYISQLCTNSMWVVLLGWHSTGPRTGTPSHASTLLQGLGSLSIPLTDRKRGWGKAHPPSTVPLRGTHILSSHFPLARISQMPPTWDAPEKEQEIESQAGHHVLATALLYQGVFGWGSAVQLCYTFWLVMNRKIYD